MGLQLNGINATSGFVSGKELEAVSSKIFQAAQAQSNVQSVDLSKVDVSRFKQVDQGVSLSGLNADNQAARQIADMNSMQLSQSALANLQALQSNAAMRNLDRIVEGKLTIPTSVKETQASGEVFPLTQTTEVLRSNQTNKDSKGSNPFAFISTFSKNEEEKDDKLTSIFA